MRSAIPSPPGAASESAAISMSPEAPMPQSRYSVLILPPPGGLSVEDRLTEHLNTVDDEAQERMDILVRHMMERQGITEEMKVRDQMEWVRAVNNIRNAAEEIVLKELIYR